MRIKTFEDELRARRYRLATMRTLHRPAFVNQTPFHVQSDQDDQTPQERPQHTHPARQARRHSLICHRGPQVQIVTRVHRRDEALNGSDQKGEKGERVHGVEYGPWREGVG